MRSIKDILKCAADRDIALHDAVLALDSEATGVPADQIRENIAQKLADMRRSAEEARASTASGSIVTPCGGLLLDYEKNGAGMSGSFILGAASIALDVAMYNAAMGRIVAAPTAGSCGILPGILFSWSKRRGLSESDTEKALVSALILAGGIGEVIANRATISGAEGGCQAECGAAAAMGAAALTYLQGGNGDAVAHSVALTLKSVMGLVCDPVGGLVESPCIKRNGLLVSIGILSADMALAGIKSVIPADEVIDAMGRVGRAMPEALRETSRGGLAVTPAAKNLAASLSGQRRWPSSK